MSKDVVGAPVGAEPSAGGCEPGQPEVATYTPKRQTLTEVFGAPEAAPIGAACVFPEWQDKHHPRDIAIRWAPPNNRDERHPWLILGSAGPQVLSNDCVINCEWLPLEELASELRHPHGGGKPQVTSDQAWRVTRCFHDATRATPFVSREQAWQSGDFESMKDAMEEAGIEVLRDAAASSRGDEA